MQGKSLGGDDFAHLERSGKVWEGVGKGTVVCKPLKVRDGRGERHYLPVKLLGIISGRGWEGVGKGLVVCNPLKVRDGRGERGEIGVSTLLSFFTHKQAETALKHTCSNLLRRKWENAFPPLPKLPVSLFINGLRDPVPFPSPSQEK